MMINQLPLQLNNYSVQNRIQQVAPEKTDIQAAKVNESQKKVPASIDIAGGDLFKPSSSPLDTSKQIYTKDSVVANISNLSTAARTERPLQDFSLTGISKVNEVKPVEEPATVASPEKIVISDEAMDNFLREAFKVFDFQ